MVALSAMLAACDRDEQRAEITSADLPTATATGPQPSTQTPDNPAGTTRPTASALGSDTGTITASTQGVAGTPADRMSPGALIESNPTSAGVPTTTSNVGATWTAMERDFAQTAAVNGLFEVEMARLAQQKASDAAVKSYAAMLVDHHIAADQKLRQLAGRGNVPLPNTLPADKRSQLDQLGQLSGADFDRQFVAKLGVQAHRQDIALFEQAANNATHPDVRAFAQATLPTLREHLASAQRLPGATGVSR